MIRRRLPALLLAALLLAAAASLVVASLPGWSVIDRQDCDNMVGQCLRQRQKAAIDGLVVLCAGLATWSVWSALVVLVRATISRRRVVLLATAVAVALACLALDPVRHPDNSRTGWLAAAVPR